MIPRHPAGNRCFELGRSIENLVRPGLEIFDCMMTFDTPTQTTAPISRYLVMAGMIAMLVLSSGCDDGVEGAADARAQAFKLSSLVLEARPSRVRVDSPVVVTTNALPLVTGKGRIGLLCYNLPATGKLVVDTPAVKIIPDDITPSGTPFVWHEVEFRANKPLALDWRVRMSVLFKYHFSADYVLDSVYIADSSRYYAVGSAEAIAQTPGRAGYKVQFSAPSALHLSP